MKRVECENKRDSRDRNHTCSDFQVSRWRFSRPILGVGSGGMRKTRRTRAGERKAIGFSVADLRDIRLSLPTTPTLPHT